MEFTMDAVANKMILLIICLSALVMVGGAVFFHFHPSFYINGAVPFAVGVAMATVVNVVKVIWLKKTITKTVDMETPKAAKLFFQLQYFLRIVFTGVVLLIAALAPDSIVNLLGVIIGIFTYPVAMHLIRFFIPKDAEIISSTPMNTDFVQDSIDDIEAIGKED